MWPGAAPRTPGRVRSTLATDVGSEPAGSLNLYQVDKSGILTMVPDFVRTRVSPGACVRKTWRAPYMPRPVSTPVVDPSNMVTPRARVLSNTTVPDAKLTSTALGSIRSRGPRTGIEGGGPGHGEPVPSRIVAFP